VVLLAESSCAKPVDLSYIKSTIWSYNGGFKIGKGDFIVFDNSGLFEIREDTIFYSNEPKAIVVSVDKDALLLKVRSLKANEEGWYRDIEESFK
jgi:GTPase SAR1 family protein